MLNGRRQKEEMEDVAINSDRDRAGRKRERKKMLQRLQK